MGAESLVEQTSDLLCLVRRDTTFLYVNPASETILGYAPKTLSGRRIVDYCHPEDVAGTLEAVKHPGRTFEVRLRHDDGRWVVLEVVTGGSAQGPEGIVLSARDVTETRKEREMLRQAQKMEAVGRLANGVAHDFNNLLTAINGYSELLLARLTVDDPQRRPLEEIRKAGRRAADITRRLLILSRHQNVSPRRLDLNQVTGDMEKLLKRVLGEDVALRTHPDVGLRPICADLSQVEQIILNLVINARDAMPGGGDLILETHSARLPESALASGLKPGEYAQLVVSDTGEGMPEEVLEHAFEPFFTTKDGRHNAGLGLAIVYGIVKQARGHVDVTSETGTGTSVRVYLPYLSEAEAEVRAADREAAVPAGHELVLLVEDEEPVRELVRQILELQGYRVEEAPEAKSALEVCDRLDVGPDVLLSDVVMPGASGVELAEILRRRYPSMRILFMSGYTDSHAEIRRLARQGASFLPKPFSPSELTRRLRELIEGRS